MRGSIFAIDWHNLAYTILSLKFPGSENSTRGDLEPPSQNAHFLVRFAYLYEQLFAKTSTINLCVSNGMKEWLKQHFNIEATVMYDKPPDFVGPQQSVTSESLEASVTEGPSSSIASDTDKEETNDTSPRQRGGEEENAAEKSTTEPTESTSSSSSSSSSTSLSTSSLTHSSTSPSDAERDKTKAAELARIFHLYGDAFKGFSYDKPTLTPVAEDEAEGNYKGMPIRMAEGVEGGEGNKTEQFSSYTLPQRRDTPVNITGATYPSQPPTKPFGIQITTSHQSVHKQTPSSSSSSSSGDTTESSAEEIKPAEDDEYLTDVSGCPFVELTQTGIRLKEDRPALLITPTSWTPGLLPSLHSNLNLALLVSLFDIFNTYIV